MAFVGVIVAAGKAERFSGLPKFALPTPDGTLLGDWCNRFIDSGAARIIVLTTSASLALVQNIVPDGVKVSVVSTPNMSQTVLAARSFCGDLDVLVAMSDTSLWDTKAISKTTAALNDNADLALGTFYVKPAQRSDLGMVDIGSNGRVLSVIDKPSNTSLTQGWFLIGYKQSLWDVLDPDSPHIGYAINPSIAAGLDVRAVKCEGPAFNINSREQYFLAVETWG